MEAEFAASGLAHERLLAARVEHVSKNRRRMVDDVAKEVDAAASDYLALVDQMEAKRQEVLDLRQLRCGPRSSRPRR